MRAEPIRQHMKTTATDGTTLSYTYHDGSAPTLVFIHGWGANWTAWKHELAYFQDLGRATLAMDLRGYGNSGKPTSKDAYTMDVFVDDLATILDAEDLDDVVLIGHSMGGMIALRYAVANEVTALVLCNSTAAPIATYKRAKPLQPLVQTIVDYLADHVQFTNEYFPELDLSALQNDYVAFLTGMQNASLSAVFAAFGEMLDFDVRASLTTLDIPVLIIEGEDDTLLPEAYGLDMYERLPNADLITTESRHYSIIQQADEVSHAIHDFVDKLPRTQPNSL